MTSPESIEHTLRHGPCALMLALHGNPTEPAETDPLADPAEQWDQEEPFPISRKRLDELRRVHSECPAAVAGLWYVSRCPEGGDAIVNARHREWGDMVITSGINPDEAELITVTVNALPALLDTIEQAHATIRHLRQLTKLDVVLNRASSHELRRLNAKLQAVRQAAA